MEKFLTGGKVKYIVAKILALTIVLTLFVACSNEQPQGELQGKTSESKEIKTPAYNSGSKTNQAELASNDEPKKEKMEQSPDRIKVAPPKVEDVGDGTELAVIKSTKGTMVVEFFPDIAPLHVANFKNLAKAGFYDGTTFHRVLPGFVMQGGDPNTLDSNPNNDGQGGPGYGVKAEFNSTPHVKGILSAARSSDPNSAGSQFFICLGRAPHLDNKYTVFGKVIKGMEIVDKIGTVRRDPSKKHDRNLPAVRMESVTVIKRSELDEVK